MEKLRFDNGYELDLMVMGIASTDEVLTVACEPDGTLTEMEGVIIQAAASGRAVLLSDGGDELRIYTGYDKLMSIAKDLSGETPVVRVGLRRTSEIEKRLDEIDTALVELAEIVAGGDL